MSNNRRIMPWDKEGNWGNNYGDDSNGKSVGEIYKLVVNAQKNIRIPAPVEEHKILGIFTIRRRLKPYELANKTRDFFNEAEDENTQALAYASSLLKRAVELSGVYGSKLSEINTLLQLYNNSDENEKKKYLTQISNKLIGVLMNDYAKTIIKNLVELLESPSNNDTSEKLATESRKLLEEFTFRYRNDLKEALNAVNTSYEGLKPVITMGMKNEIDIGIKRSALELMAGTLGAGMSVESVKRSLESTEKALLEAMDDMIKHFERVEKDEKEFVEKYNIKIKELPDKNRANGKFPWEG